jgi:hypothetical protein
MPDLETELRRYGAHLDEKYPDVTRDEIVARARGRARPLRRGLRLAVAAAVMAGLAGVGLVVALDLITGATAPAPVIAPAPDRLDRNETSDESSTIRDEERADFGVPPGLVAADRDGVYLVPLEAPEKWRLLGSDGFEVAWAMPDHQGGLIFQYEVTPEPWPAGAILWLRAGAPHPEVLVTPAVRGDGFPIAGLWPFGIATSSDGQAVFVYTAETATPTDDAEVMAADLDGSGTIRQLATVDSYPGFMLGGFAWLLVGGDLVAVVEPHPEQEDCDLVALLLRVDDGARLPATSDCLPGGPWGLRSLSHDGRTLAAIDWSDLGGTVAAREFTVTVIDIATGASLEEVTIDLDLRLDDVGLVPTPTGWLAYARIAPDWRTDQLAEIRVLHLDGTERTRIDRTLVPSSLPGSWVGHLTNRFYHQPFELAPDASLLPPNYER